MALELKLTVLNFSSVVVSGSCVDVSGAEHQSYLHYLLFSRLIHPSDIHCKLAESMNMSIIHKLNLGAICLVKNYSHYSLTGPNRTVNLRMDFINTDRLPFTNECIKNIFTEIFSINDYPFALRV